jgi:hypothetical protein
LLKRGRPTMPGFGGGIPLIARGRFVALGVEGRDVGGSGHVAPLLAGTI